ncbi:unnamed protein product, partial [Candidula unifasciata]
MDEVLAPFFHSRQIGGFVAGISVSADNIFKKGMSAVTVSGRVRPALKKFEPVKKRPLEADLIEVVGKKTKPLWHIVAMEPVVDPLLRY